MDGEIDRIWDLENRALAHLNNFAPYPRESIESLVMPLKDLADPELILFAEIDGKTVGWFPGIPNFNEILIHLNGLRYPWDYLRALRYRNLQPQCVSIKSVVVPPEYWDTGVAILLFDEMARRVAAKGYRGRIFPSPARIIPIPGIWRITWARRFINATGSTASRSPRKFFTTY